MADDVDDRLRIGRMQVDLEAEVWMRPRHVDGHVGRDERQLEGGRVGSNGG